MIAVVSANHGDYDTPKTHTAQDVTVEVVTDVQPAGDRRTAKRPKLRPWDVVPGADAWIWIDGSYEITSPSFAREAVAATTEPIGMFAHGRGCIYPEAAFSAGLPKYAGEPLAQQAEHYRSIGHPENWGLWCAGFIVYGEPLPRLAAMWQAELDQWSTQDQVSLPVALRRVGLRPTSIPGLPSRNPWLAHRAHADGTV